MAVSAQPPVGPRGPRFRSEDCTTVACAPWRGPFRLRSTGVRRAGSGSAAARPRGAVRCEQTGGRRGVRVRRRVLRRRSRLGGADPPGGTRAGSARSVPPAARRGSTARPRPQRHPRGWPVALLSACSPRRPLGAAADCGGTDERHAKPRRPGGAADARDGAAQAPRPAGPGAAGELPAVLPERRRRTAAGRPLPARRRCGRRPVGERCRGGDRRGRLGVGAEALPRRCGQAGADTGGDRAQPAAR